MLTKYSSEAAPPRLHRREPKQDIECKFNQDKRNFWAMFGLQLVCTHTWTAASSAKTAEDLMETIKKEEFMKFYRICRNSDFFSATNLTFES